MNRPFMLCKKRTSLKIPFESTTSLYVRTNPHDSVTRTFTGLSWLISIPSEIDASWTSGMTHTFFPSKSEHRTIRPEKVPQAATLKAFDTSQQASKIVYTDIEDVDVDIFNSLESYKTINFDENKEIDVRFELYVEEGETIELKPNGSEIRLNNENRDEYNNLVVKYRLIDSIKKQVEAFCKGFDSIVPHQVIRMFSPTELNFQQMLQLCCLYI